MNHSHRKTKHISESNMMLETRYLNEQGLKNIFKKNDYENTKLKKSQSDWENLITKGVQDIDGFYVCTGKGNSRHDIALAKKMATNVCDGKILSFLKKSGQTLNNSKISDEAIWENPNGGYDYYVTLKVNKSDL